MDNTKPDAEELLIRAVAVKLSPFCSSEAASWFRRAEFQFRLRRVTDPRTKADYVLEAISEELFPCVAAWLDNQDMDAYYEDLKSYLLQEFTLCQRPRPTSPASSTSASRRLYCTRRVERDAGSRYTARARLYNQHTTACRPALRSYGCCAFPSL